MSFQTQAILQGHLTAAEIAVRIEQVSRFKVLGYRTMRLPEHVLFELEDARGDIMAVEAFLQSWAADDYRATCDGPTTLLTAEYSPAAAALVSAIAGQTGFVRDTDMSPWRMAGTVRS